MPTARSSTNWTASCISTIRASDPDRALAITVPADDTTTPAAGGQRRRQYREPNPSAPAASGWCIVARGDVFTVPVEHGVTRNLTHSSNAHDREAAWSSDGKRLAFVSDRSGEEELYVQAQDGSAPAAAVTSDSTARYYAPRWSGDDRRIAVADQTGRLYVIDIAAKRRIEIAKDPLDLALDYQLVAGRPIPRLLARRGQRLLRRLHLVGGGWGVAARHPGILQCAIAGLGAERRVAVFPERAGISSRSSAPSNSISPPTGRSAYSPWRCTRASRIPSACATMSPAMNKEPARTTPEEQGRRQGQRAQQGRRQRAQPGQGQIEGRRENRVRRHRCSG